ncbi:MAG: HD domain-containing protein, partial [Chloroflexi bacterium]|nr:HD domain-containing protein [Chloroflexota bacterium]
MRTLGFGSSKCLGILPKVWSLTSCLLGTLDSETYEHSTRVAQMAVSLAELLYEDSDMIDMICVGALLHDVGKARVDKSLLSKPQRLDKSERNLLKQHPTIGAQLVMFYNFPPQIVNMIYYHHERIDGWGYPVGLRRDEIPLAARVIAVVDSFDAMISKRSYKPSMPLEDAIQEIAKCAGSQFDPYVADGFNFLLTRHVPMDTPKCFIRKTPSIPFTCGLAEQSRRLHLISLHSPNIVMSEGSR